MNQETNKNKGKNKKNNKGNKKEDIPDDLQNEIFQYLAQTEKIVQNQKEEEEEISALKNKQSTILNEFNSLSPDEMFKRIVEMLNETIDEDDKLKATRKSIDDSKTQITIYQDNMNNLNQQMLNLDAYNKSIMEQIKKITEDTQKIALAEEEKYKDIQRQCEDFKQQSKQKYDESSNDVIVRDNEMLQAKLEECQTNTAKIKENIESQFELKEKQSLDFKEMFESQISGKLGELTQQSGEFGKENEELKVKLQSVKKQYDSLANSMKKFNKKFETSKKEYDRTIKDLFTLGKEAQELRSSDSISIKKEIEKNETVLKELVAKNKDLQSKIKELKEDK